jgi:hypothetical protein
MERLVITLIEKDNEECPNIGTIICGEDTAEKAKMAISSHFDREVGKIQIQGGLLFEDVKNSNPLDAIVCFEGGEKAQIEIQQTWLY